MADTTKSLEVEKEEFLDSEGAERTREVRCFVPRADIYEMDDQIVILTDVPGASEKSIDIQLEKNVLTINAAVNPDSMEDYSLAYAEYEVGDFTRSFRLSNAIDQDKIKATLKDGVLQLVLPKAPVARARKIQLKAG